VTLVAREVDFGGAAPEIYHGLEVADYVTVLAVTADGRVPLVRQFRPAVEKYTIELPGGLAELDGRKIHH
jgi:ADP-ribose pyrophosphatase